MSLQMSTMRFVIPINRRIKGYIVLVTMYVIGKFYKVHLVKISIKQLVIFKKIFKLPKFNKIFNSFPIRARDSEIGSLYYPHVF